jgi:Ras-related protein Rab-8A
VELWVFSLSSTLPTSEASTVRLDSQGWSNPTVTSDAPFLDIRTWHSNVEQHASEGVNKILVGNKCDWDDKRVITESQARELAEELGIDYLETSAKSAIRVDDAFFTLARDIKKRLIDSSASSPTTPNTPASAKSVNVNDAGAQDGKSGCC